MDKWEDYLMRIKSETEAHFPFGILTNLQWVMVPLLFIHIIAVYIFFHPHRHISVWHQYHESLDKFTMSNDIALVHTYHCYLPYSPAYNVMPLYTKPPIFRIGQVVSDISACRTLFGDYGMSYYMKLSRKLCRSIWNSKNIMIWKTHWLCHIHFFNK